MTTDVEKQVNINYTIFSANKNINNGQTCSTRMKLTVFKGVNPRKLYVVAFWAQISIVGKKEAKFTASTA